MISGSDIFYLNIGAHWTTPQELFWCMLLNSSRIILVSGYTLHYSSRNILLHVALLLKKYSGCTLHSSRIYLFEYIWNHHLSYFLQHTETTELNCLLSAACPDSCRLLHIVCTLPLAGWNKKYKIKIS